MGGSLFERLTKGEAGRTLDEDLSIRNHLLRMLTTRQGAVQSLPDYGLPDLNDLTLSKSELQEFTCRAIEQCIDRYEPRLSLPKVSPLPLRDSSPFTLNFEIRAMKVAADGKLVPWEWKVSMEKDKVRDY